MLPISVSPLLSVFMNDLAHPDASLPSSSHRLLAEFHSPYGAFTIPELAAALGCPETFNTILPAGQVYNNFATCTISSSH